WRPLFCNATATTEIYTLSLHDALPILIHQIHDQLEFVQTFKVGDLRLVACLHQRLKTGLDQFADAAAQHHLLAKEVGFGLFRERSEEHTSELQSRENLVCRLLLEKKKK